MIRTLIVDDSPLVRTIIKDFLESDDSFQVVGEATNGLEGVNQARRLNPDLITMDVEMPVMTGLEAIDKIKDMAIPIVVISTYSTAKMAYDATVRGAMECYPKEIFTSSAEGQQQKILKALKHIAKAGKKKPVRQNAEQENRTTVSRQIECVVIASSTGGPKALCRLCTGISEAFPVPIVLVQHNTPGFDRGFAQWLDGYTPLHVCLAEEKIVPAKGNLYVAPTEKHLMLTKKGFLFDDGQPVHSQKPAADVLFKSAAELYRESLVSVVLTGMGSDGADGTRYVKQAGGITIAQDEVSSMIYGMPQAAAETGCVDMVLPLDAIARHLTSFTQKRNGI